MTIRALLARTSGSEFRTLAENPRRRVRCECAQKGTTFRAGYFSVFKETPILLLLSITSSVKAGSDFVPDISVGIAWPKSWSEKELETRYGPRRK